MRMYQKTGKDTLGRVEPGRDINDAEKRVDIALVLLQTELIFALVGIVLSDAVKIRIMLLAY